MNCERADVSHPSFFKKESSFVATVLDALFY